MADTAAPATLDYAEQVARVLAPLPIAFAGMAAAAFFGAGAAFVTLLSP